MICCSLSFSDYPEADPAQPDADQSARDDISHKMYPDEHARDGQEYAGGHHDHRDGRGDISSRHGDYEDGEYVAARERIAAGVLPDQRGSIPDFVRSFGVAGSAEDRYDHKGDRRYQKDAQEPFVPREGKNGQKNRIDDVKGFCDQTVCRDQKSPFFSVLLKWTGEPVIE